MAASTSVRPSTSDYDSAAPPDCSLARRSRAEARAVGVAPTHRGHLAAGRIERNPSLGKDAKSEAAAGQTGVTDEQRRLLARRDRYDARVRMRDFTGLQRVSQCGRVAVTEDGAVYLRASTGDDCRAGLGGLSTCGSVWACPVCSAKIARTRIAELDKLLAWNDARGGSAGLATFTMSHRQEQSLKSLWDGLSIAWRYMTTGRAGKHWRTLRDLLGNDHYVRATEVTVGENGWHVHIHLLLLFDRRVTEGTVAGMADQLYRLWSRALAYAGFTASRRHGVDVRRCSDAAQSLERIATYFEKLSFEGAGARFKSGRKGGRTPFEVLADGLATGLADDLETWLEWERASKGRRQLVWSRGLKAAAAIDELSDEEIAEASDQGETLLVLPKLTWREVYPVAIHLLEATEVGGIAGAMLWLEDRQLAYEVPDTLPP